MTPGTPTRPDGAAPLPNVAQNALQRVATALQRDASALEAILEREGGWNDRPDDPGGPTMHGVTLRTLRRLWPRLGWPGEPTIDRLRALTADEARTIFALDYLVDPSIDLVPDPTLRAQLVDFAVHSGPPRAVKVLQRVIGATDDGEIGPQTLATLDRVLRGGAREVRNHLALARARFLARLVAHDGSLLWALEGWMDRALDFVEP